MPSIDFEKNPPPIRPFLKQLNEESMERKKQIEAFYGATVPTRILTLKDLQNTEHSADKPEQPPIPNTEPAMWDLVVADMQERDKMGLQKYGTRLQPFNGRSPLWDAYQEALDLVVYLRQAIYEEETKKKLNKRKKKV